MKRLTGNSQRRDTGTQILIEKESIQKAEMKLKDTES
jgi:hypothetical protein